MSAKLLFIAERFPPDLGGLAASAGRIAHALVELGWQVDVLVWSRQLPAGDVRGPSVENRDTAASPRVYRLGQYRNWDMNFNYAMNVIDWLRQHRNYRLVWGHYLFPAGFLATWFGGLHSVPSVVSARGNDVDRGAFGLSDFGRLRWTLEQADLITSVSEELAAKLAIICQRDDICILKNAVNSAIFTPASDPEAEQTLKQRLGIAPEETVLGFSGELREKKGQAFLLQALTEVRQKRPACLLVIGEIRATQEAHLEAYGLNFPEDHARLIVTGHLEDPRRVAEHLRLCDLFLLPSLWEGMPNALLEALACGRPCLTSDAGGIPEIIRHGEQGFMLPRHQLHRLGQAALECLALPPVQRQAIAEAGRQRVLEEFSPKMEKQRLATFLGKLEE